MWRFFKGLLMPRVPVRPSVAATVEAALDKLRGFEPRVAQIVELRFLEGMTVDEAAARLQLPREIAKRDWVFGKAWLRTELRRQFQQAA
jgi:DNA-directed RNA polymerase specialized sigma24 family protein